MKYQCYVFNSNKVEIGHFCKSQVKQMFLITNILHDNLHCILVLLWNNQMDKKFHHSVFVFHKLHVRRYAGDARETFVLWPLNGLGHLCMCASVCVCALLEHQEASFYLPSATFLLSFPMPYTSTVYCISPSIFHYIPSVFLLPCTVLQTSVPSSIIILIATLFTFSTAFSYLPRFSSFLPPSFS